MTQLEQVLFEAVRQSPQIVSHAHVPLPRTYPVWQAVQVVELEQAVQVEGQA
jgi:hypothetical protein